MITFPIALQDAPSVQESIKIRFDSSLIEL